VISLLGLGWYAKNDILYGFFGASSWQGFGLWKVASQGYSREELFDLRDAGVIAPLAAEVEVLRPASAYAPYGFTRTSSIPVIGRDDRQNINLVGVAQVYQESALRLIELNPTRQLAAMMNSYRIFNIPSAEFKHHALNAPRIPFSVWLASRILQGGILDDYLPRPIGSAFFFLIPLSILVYGVGLIASLRSGVRKLDEYLRRRSLDTWIAFLIGYTTMVSVLFEVGENNREKFYIEQLVIVFLIAAFSRLVAWVQRRRPSGVAVPVPGSGNGL
jgi:hypothetical protein